MEQRPTAYMREMLALSYIQKWIEQEIQQYEDMDHVDNLVHFADRLHQQVHAEIVRLKRELKELGVHITESRSEDKVVYVQYRKKDMYMKRGLTRPR